MKTKNECIDIIHTIDKTGYCPLLITMLDYYQLYGLQDLSEEQANDFIDNKRWQERKNR